jgi:hypothetical protein
MTVLTKILLVVLAAFLIWQMYSFVKNNPQSLSRDNLSRSVFTLGMLCLFLIAFVVLLVWMLKGF